MLKYIFKFILFLAVLLVANVIGSVIIISILEPYFREFLFALLFQQCSNLFALVIAVVVIAFGYQYFASFYRASAREVKRLDALLRSLLYSHFSESLTGV